LDTSVFIRLEAGRALPRNLLPDEGYVTVVTLAELEAGVLAAQTVDARSARLKTLQSLAGLPLLAIDARAAHEWVILRNKVAESHRQVNVNDMWIAAVALSRELPVVTQDGDFDVFRECGGPEVVTV